MSPRLRKGSPARSAPHRLGAARLEADGQTAPTDRPADRRTYAQCRFAVNSVGAQLRRGPSSVFVSQTQRLAKTTAADGPAPGQYEIPNTIGDVRHGTSRSDVFVSRSARFQGAWGSGGEAPGPGSYDPGAFRMPERKLVDKAVFLSNEQRFKDEQKRRGGSMPGPGAYDEPTNTMLKRSYNVTIEGALS